MMINDHRYFKIIIIFKKVLLFQKPHFEKYFTILHQFRTLPIFRVKIVVKLSFSLKFDFNNCISVEMEIMLLLWFQRQVSKFN